MTAIVVAIISGMFGLLSTLLGIYMRVLAGRIGKPNGHGNVMQMTERILAGQATQDERLGHLERDVNRITKRVVNLEHEQLGL